MKRSRDNTAKLAKSLWTIESRNLPPATFQSRFDAIYASAEGPATLWQLGGAAYDYLRAHPDSIDVPEELITSLLASTIVDGRIIGLKLLNCCSADLSLVCSSLCYALASNHEGELYGGLYELDSLLQRHSSISVLLAADLSRNLSNLQASIDPYVRERAKQLADQLDEFAIP